MKTKAQRDRDRRTVKHRSKLSIDCRLCSNAGPFLSVRDITRTSQYSLIIYDLAESTSRTKSHLRARAARAARICEPSELSRASFGHAKPLRLFLSSSINNKVARESPRALSLLAKNTGAPCHRFSFCSAPYARWITSGRQPVPKSSLVSTYFAR